MKISQNLKDMLKSKETADNPPKNPRISQKNIVGALADLNMLKMTEIVYRKISCTLRAAFAASGKAVESYWLYAGDGIVRDIIVPTQTVSGAHVHVHLEDILGLKEYIRETGMPIMGWGHSHANFAVFFSGTDWANQEKLLHETSNIVYLEKENTQIKYVYGSTFNIHGETYIMFTYTGEDGEIIHKKIELRIIPTGSATFNEREYMKELAEKFNHYWPL